MDEDFSHFTTPSGVLHTLLSLRTHIATSLFTSHVYYHLIEASFFVLIIYLAFTRAYKPWARHSVPTLSTADQSARLAAWKPEPLYSPPSSHKVIPATLSPTSSSSLSLDRPDIEIEATGAGPVTYVKGQGRVINVATHNFLGLLKHERVESAALSVMREYGCGACGPRGFYGTTDIHLECEAALAHFCGTSTAILYSFGAATASSTIPAFVKRGDLLVVDDAIAYPLRAGARLSRARVIPFKHNDMSDLHRILQKVVDEEGGFDSTQAHTQRRLILVEGISSTRGDVCPLDQVVLLKEKFRFRLLVDESLSLGVLGETGRGALQEFGINRSDVEFATADLGNAFATVGGFCVGRNDVVDHQRLSGAGYCFSASQPPFLAKAATTAVHLLTEDGSSFVSKLRRRIQSFRQSLPAEDLKKVGWQFACDERSPVIFFTRSDNDWSLDTFFKAHDRCLKQGVLVAPPLSPPDDPIALPVHDGDDVYHRPAIRVSLSAGHSAEQVCLAAKTISSILIDMGRQ